MKTIQDAVASLSEEVKPFILGLWAHSGIEDSYDGDLKLYLMAIWQQLDRARINHKLAQQKLQQIEQIMQGRLVAQIDMTPDEKGVFEVKTVNKTNEPSK